MYQQRQQNRGIKIAIIIIAGVLIFCAAGLITYSVLKGKSADQAPSQQQPAQAAQTTQAAQPQETPQSGTLTDGAYPEMIAGGLSKDEVSTLLACTTADLEDSMGDVNDTWPPTELNYDDYLMQIDKSSDMILYCLVKYTDGQSLDMRDGEIVVPLSEMNSYRAFWNLQPYEENTADPSGSRRTDDQNLYVVPGWGDGPGVESMNITSAEYNGDEMTIHYDLTWDDLIMNRGDSGSYAATLEKQSDGKYALVDIEKE